MKKIFIICLLLFTFACDRTKELLKKYPQDNVIEEAIEEVIEEQTGMDVDLSPFSPEH